MTEAINSIRNSKAVRWTALLTVSFTMMCGYFMTDVMAPLKPMLENELSWNSGDYGLFTSAYGWFNVFLLMLIFGGLILDKMGVRFTGTMATALMVIGAVVKYWAISTPSLADTTWHILFWDMSAQVWMAALGFAIFGVGLEVSGTVATKIIVKWFRGKEMALAMGLQVALARMGTLAALVLSPRLARYFSSVSAPVLFAMVLLCIGLISFLVYCVMDKRLDRSEQNIVTDNEEFKLADIRVIFQSRGFWLIAILCVLFYSAIFPFLKYAPDLMVNKFGVDEAFAGDIPSILPFGTLLLTPFFGSLYDRKGKGATIMLIGALMVLGIHLLFAIPALNEQWIAIVLCVLLGISFSLVPSALWPSVSKIIPDKQLGTAYSLVFWIQNIGLMTIPYLIGWVLNQYCVIGQKEVEGKMQQIYDYTVPMLIFASLGALAVIVALILKREDKRQQYGLEQPNIKNI